MELSLCFYHFVPFIMPAVSYIAEAGAEIFIYGNPPAIREES